MEAEGRGQEYENIPKNSYSNSTKVRIRILLRQYAISFAEVRQRESPLTAAVHGSCTVRKLRQHPRHARPRHHPGDLHAGPQPHRVRDHQLPADTGAGIFRVQTPAAAIFVVTAAIRRPDSGDVSRL